MKTLDSIEEGAKSLGCPVEQLYQLLNGKEGIIEVDTRYVTNKDIKDMGKEEVQDRIKFLERLGACEIEKDTMS